MVFSATDPAPVNETPPPSPPASAPAKPITVASISWFNPVVSSFDRAVTETEPPLLTVALSIAARVMSEISLSPKAPAPAREIPAPWFTAAARASEPAFTRIFAELLASSVTSPPLAVAMLVPSRTKASTIALVVLPAPAPAPPKATPPAPVEPAAAPATASASMVAVEVAVTVTAWALSAGVPIAEPSISARIRWSRSTPPIGVLPIRLDATETPTAPATPPPLPPASEIAAAPASEMIVEASLARTVTAPPGSMVLALMLASTVLAMVLPVPDPAPSRDMPPADPPDRARLSPTAMVWSLALELADTDRSCPTWTVAWSTLARTVCAMLLPARAPAPATAAGLPWAAKKASAPAAASASAREKSSAESVTSAAGPVTTVVPERSSASTVLVTVLTAAPAAPPSDTPPSRGPPVPTEAAPTSTLASVTVRSAAPRETAPTGAAVVPSVELSTMEWTVLVTVLATAAPAPANENPPKLPSETAPARPNANESMCATEVVAVRLIPPGATTGALSAAWTMSLIWLIATPAPIVIWAPPLLPRFTPIAMPPASASIVGASEAVRTIAPVPPLTLLPAGIRDSTVLPIRLNEMAPAPVTMRP